MQSSMKISVHRNRWPKNEAKLRLLIKNNLHFGLQYAFITVGEHYTLIFSVNFQLFSIQVNLVFVNFEKIL